MAQSKVTLNEIMKAVRELTFDRFIIPAFAIKQIGSGNFIEIDPSFEPEISDPNVEPVKGKLTLYKVAEGETEESSKKIIVEIIFHEYPTMASCKLVNLLSSRGVSSTETIVPSR